MRGYTLIELLIVMLIMSIIGVIGYVSYKQFAANQVTNKAVGQVQTLLRLAQTNATTYTMCSDNTTVVGPWSLVFNQNKTSIDLVCGTSRKTYTLENAQIDEIRGLNCGGSVIPLTVTYSNGVGAMTFVSQEASSPCLASVSWTFTISNTKNNSTKSFKLSQGGAINVE